MQNTRLLLPSFIFHELCIGDVEDKVRMTILLLHDDPKCLVDYQHLRLLFRNHGTPFQDHHSLILHFGSNFIHFELNLLQHHTYKISLQLPVDYHLVKHLHVISFDIELQLGHCKLVSLFQVSDVIFFHRHSNNILRSRITPPLDNVQLLVGLFQSQPQNEVAVICVFEQLDISALLVSFCFESLDSGFEKQKVLSDCEGYLILHCLDEVGV